MDGHNIHESKIDSTKRIMKQTHESGQLPYLPQEIIFNILIRNSIETVSRFRCVSKTWLSTISSPDFMKGQADMPSSNPRVILGCDAEPDSITFYTYSINKCNKSLEDEQLIKLELDSNQLKEDPYFDYRYAVDVVGSCNGLCCILLTYLGYLILWNPSTRKSKQIPMPESHLVDRKVMLSGLSYGFIYDDSCDDYKVVHLETFYYDNTLILRIYSLRANSWTKIHKYYSKPLISAEAVSAFVNGKQHWVSRRKNCSSIVFSYDLNTESIGEIMLPCDGKGVWSLGDYRGYLCCQQDPDIWIMKEYGVQQSWKKIASYCSEEHMFRWNLSSINEMGLDGIEYDGAFLNVLKHSWDWKAEVGILEYQQQWHWSAETYSCVNVTPYIESHVSPTAGERKRPYILE